MLVEEVDVAVIDALCDLLADLVRSAALNHVQLCPSVLSLCAGRSSDEEVVLELSLKTILLDVIGERGWNFPGR